MPSLLNPRHELFAQALAAGQSQGEAYVAAGYAVTSARQNACKLLQRKDDISQRVSELLQQRHDAEGQAVAEAAAALAITKRSVLEKLQAIQTAAIRTRQDGRPENLPAACRATELIGKALGMFRDQKETPGGSLEDWLAKLEEDDKLANTKEIPAPSFEDRLSKLN